MQLSSPADVARSEPASAEEAVMATLIRLGRRMRQRLPGDRIDFSTLPVLDALQHDGPMRLSALAGHLGLDASTVSRHARHLEDRGLIVRTDDPDDGRASRVMLSEQGAECLQRGASARREIIAGALEAWSDAERDQLRTLLHRFYTNLDTAQETA